ncbi:hypothetical protein [Arcobacter sp. LA11]|uniref:hypothetical protein n=1 Tax=Arcobacter sp. LA11 TaxID=1898176 RepID=UPI0009348180|nr:hypothetical protein [Arcobacter sp. LA11]
MNCLNTFSNRIKRLELLNKYTMLLNPADNIQMCNNIKYKSFSNLYIPDSPLSDNQIEEASIGFANRNSSAKFIQELLEQWKIKFNAEECTLRPLSGMHSLHIILSSLKNHGNRILVLPEKAGGHPFTSKILQSFNFDARPLIYNQENYLLDIEANIKAYKKFNPDFILIDRSDGLIYEDFSKLLKYFKNSYSIFDASHYLTHILAEDYISPFEMGFNLITSSLHKNFPGPQKGILITKKKDTIWSNIKNVLSNHISNTHPLSIMCAGEILLKTKYIRDYSYKMLNNKLLLENELINKGFNIISTPKYQISSNHIWIEEKGLVNNAMKFFRDLEFCRISTNYRILPFNIGSGIRLGTAGITNQGLDKNYIKALADILYSIAINGKSLNNRHRVKGIILEMNSNLKK